MLKIKDGTSLEELEKFGFELVEAENEYWRRTNNEAVCIMIKNRHIYCEDYSMWSIIEEGLDVIFDLIQAGLVEKVEEVGYED